MEPYQFEMMSRPTSPNDIRVRIENVENDKNVNRNTHPVAPEKDPRILDYDGRDIPLESANRMMRNETNEVDLMLQLADKMHELAEHLKLLVSTSSRHVNVPEVERLTDGAFSGVLRDIRKETLLCIIDGQRACVRYEKVMNDLRRLRRSLRSMGQWRTVGERSGTTGNSGSSNGRADSGETICPDGDWSLPRYSYFNSP